MSTVYNRLSLASDPGNPSHSLIFFQALEALSPLHPEPSTVIQPRRQSNLGAALASSLQPPLSTIKPTTHAPLQSTKLDNYVSEASSSSPTRDDPHTPLARRTNLDEQAFGRLSLTGSVEPRYLSESSKVDVGYSSKIESKPEPRYSLGEASKVEPRYSLGEASKMEPRYSLGDTLKTDSSKIESKVEPRYSLGDSLKAESKVYSQNESSGSRYSLGDVSRQSLVNDVRLSIANELDNSRLRTIPEIQSTHADIKPQQQQPQQQQETSPSVRIANTLRRLDAELAKSQQQQQQDRPIAISADAAPPNLESIRQLRMENEQRKVSAPATTSVSTSSTTAPPSTQLIKALIQEALEDFSASLRNDLQNMHIELIRQSMAQRQLIESLLATDKSDQNDAELQRLRTENEHLKQLLNRH